LGEEVTTSRFDASDFARFERHLTLETEALRRLAAEGQVSDAGYSMGFELESWLLDHNFFPNPINETLLTAIDHPFVVPELSRFNLELNCEPLILSGSALRRAEQALGELWAQCNAIAHDHDANMVMIGTLPVIRDDDLTLDNMSGMKRYEALNAEILRLRDGRPLVLDVEGREHLQSVHGDVMLEAATTSFQIHLKVPASLAHRYYNASMMVSGPLLAACTNAPFLFGKDVWAETRIPLFEQAIGLNGRHGGGRVTFGSGYLDESLVEALEENHREYPVLLPLAVSAPDGEFRHLSLHNGTIWRWNRPLIGFDGDGSLHFRIEHRALPAGPTILDMIANAAGFFGMVGGLVAADQDRTAAPTFREAHDNFYAAARHGLDATLTWPGLGEVPAQDLLLDHLLPLADDGLVFFGIDPADRSVFLDILDARVRSGQTGAA